MSEELRESKANGLFIRKTLNLGSEDRDVETSRQLESEERAAFTAAGAIEPPYSPKQLIRIAENSSILQQNVSSYETNIDGNGYHLQPLFKTDSDDRRQVIENAIYVERLLAKERGEVVLEFKPTAEEIEKKLQEVTDTMRLEHFRATKFFDSCTVGSSFTKLRRNTRVDLEVTGNGYWEVLRDKKDQIAQFEYLPSHSMRLLPVHDAWVDVMIPVRTSPLTLGKEIRARRFRRFVQVVGSRRIFFKELGDPRVMSSETGRFYESVLDMQNKEDPKVRPATEVVHFKIHSPSDTPYGIPRWIGTLLSVLGNRDSEEVNYDYFRNKSVPPLALLVSGASIGKDTVKRIESFLENNIKGKANYHKILVIEAEPTSTDPSMGAPNKIRLELRPLTQAQNSDALFQKYDERNMDKVGMAFRLPRLLRGDTRDFNRATAETAVDFTETQVFGPEREDFDFMINKLVLAPMGIRYYAFQTNSVQVRDPKTVAEMIERLARVNVLVPADGRDLAEELVFNRKLRNLNADWVFQPPMLTQVGVPLDTAQDGSIPMPRDANLDINVNPDQPPKPTSIRLTREHEVEPELAARLEMLRQKFDDAEYAAEFAALLDQRKKERADEPVEKDIVKPEGATVIKMPLESMLDQFDLKKA
jgi:PBSX family phage portal protein